MAQTPLKIWKTVESLELSEIEGGATELALTELRDLFMIPWLIMDADATPALRISPDPKLDYASVEATASAIEGGVVVGHRQSGARFQSLNDIDDLSALLGSLEDGTEVELVTAEDDEAEARHRYWGKVKGGAWQISSSYPKITRNDLIEALALVRQSGAITMASQEMAEIAAANAEEFFEGTNMEVARDGLKLQGLDRGEPSDTVLELVRVYAFRARFADGPWAIPDEAEDDFDLASLNAQLTAAFTTPDPSGERLILDGSFGRFFSGDLSQEDHMVPEDSVLLDEQMEELGFRPLGDMTCNKVYHTVFRGYADSESCFAVGAAGAGCMFAVDFYSAFEDGSSLTTSNNPDVRNIPKKKIYRQSFPSLTPAELRQEHLKAMKERKSPALVRKPTIKGLAEAIDEYLSRQGMVF